MLNSMTDPDDGIEDLLAAVDEIEIRYRMSFAPTSLESIRTLYEYMDPARLLNEILAISVKEAEHDLTQG